MAEQQRAEATTGAWSDQETEVVIGSLLRIGVLLSAAVVAVGGAVYLAHFGGQMPHHETFRAEPGDLRSPLGAVHLALTGNSRGIIQTGLLLLIATPVARVLFSVYAFAREQDRLYVALTLVVFAVLVYGLFAQ